MIINQFLINLERLSLNLSRRFGFFKIFKPIYFFGSLLLFSIISFSIIVNENLKNKRAKEISSFLSNNQTVLLRNYVFNKINEKIREDGGLEQFISFDETPDGGCFQNELLTWIINENKSNEIFEAPNLMGRKFNKNELKKLNDWFEECEGGYRPTLIVDSENEEDYSLAEQGESIINNYETNGVIYAAGFAAENNMDLDLIYEAWSANGWEDEINALKLFSQKK